jgi:hypothetical protein
MEGLAVETFAETGSVLQQTLANLWGSFVAVFPGIIAAIILIIIGWIVGKIIDGVLQRLLSKLKLDYWLEKEGLKQALWGKNLSSILGSLLKWYIVVVFLGAAAALIEMQPLVTFINSVVHYLPALFGAFIIIIIGMIVGEHIKKKIEMAKIKYSDVMGQLAKYLVIYFTVVIGLQTAGFEVTILIDAFRIAFAAFAITVAIIIGIGFGFAFKEDAKKIFKEMKADVKKGGRKKK